MKYKVLLAGNSKQMINNFFVQMDFSFECMSSSMIYDDLKRHLEYFKPDIFVFCMRAETRDDIIIIASFHELLSRANVPYAAIGDGSAIDFVGKIAYGEPELALRLPINTVEIQEKISRYIVSRKASAAQNAENALLASVPGAISDATVSMLARVDAELEMLEKGFAPRTPALSSAVPRQPEDPDRRRILIIDDATIVHKTIKGHLDPAYEVAAAISGKIAMRFLQMKMVSLILLDYEMPDMNGPAVLAMLREDPCLARIPVVFLTGINDVEKIKNALSLKPQGYLLKPINREALLDKIHELIG